MIDQATIDKILKEYDTSVPIYSAFTIKLNELLCEIIDSRALKVHSVPQRTKSKKSFKEKLERPDSAYFSLADITDVSGERIITFFSDEVDTVASVIQSEFVIDKANSVDKRAQLDPDRFGYLSLHFVVSLPASRILLPEYSRFKGLKAEIQIRSILQHAWAEIEHDHGYRTAKSIPDEVRRQFSRLAGLLELADEEFIRIRKTLTSYREVLPELIRTIPESVSLDRTSLTELVSTNETIHQMDSTIASICGGATLYPVTQLWLDRTVEELAFFNIRTIAELQTAISARSELVIAFAKNWLEGYTSRSLSQSISLFYLQYVLVGESRDIQTIRAFLERFSIGDSDKRAQTSSRVLQIYLKVVGAR